jgi:DnaJ like chaperone protein
MSIWSRITAAIAALSQGQGLATVFDTLRPNRAPERSVAFTIAVIALGAKMAKADGQVTRDEVSAFRRVFTIPKADEAAAARVFDLARQDVAGFDAYARKIGAMFGPKDRDVLIDLMGGLFHIAMADGAFHPSEDAFLRAVADIFGLGERCYRALRAQHVADTAPDPMDVLGLAPDATLAEARAAWRQAVKRNHPDKAIARGLPPEAIKLAEERLRAVNAAWEELSSQRAA